MLYPWTVLIALHAIAATSAVTVGIFQILRPHRGDPTHRIIGRIWGGTMYFVAITGLMIDTETIQAVHNSRPDRV